MDYRKLGHSGLKASPLWLGTMMFGDRTDGAEAGRILAAPPACGFVDSASALPTTPQAPPPPQTE